MRKTLPWLWTAVVALFAIACGLLSAKYVPLASISPAFSSLLTALSLLAGAALVRMARNAPITSPSTFDDDDLKRFFDTLETLAYRLFWIFLQTLTAIAVLLIAIVLAGTTHPTLPFYDDICGCVSGLIAFSFIWLLWRLTSIARGDIGFVRLQRQILENALARERRKEVAKVLGSPVTRVSPGKFGGMAAG